ncbi:unnamed protein product, partial [Meganyctiphanes norvegica]
FAKHQVPPSRISSLETGSDNSTFDAITSLDSWADSFDHVNNYSTDLKSSSMEFRRSSVDSISCDSSLASTATIITSSNPTTNSSSFSSITTITSKSPSYPVVCMKTKMDDRMQLLHKEI